MGGQTTSSSSSESSQHGMEKFQHLGVHHAPPPRPTHSRRKKHHRHRHHYCSSPPSPSGHRRHQIFDHSPVERPHHHNLPPLMGRPDHHHHKLEGKLRGKTPKHLKKVHKLHHKIMKAYKFPKGIRHGVHHRHHVHFPPPEEGFCSTPFGHHHPPGCCLHSIEAMEGSSVVHEMSFCHHYHPRCRGRYPHPRHPSRPLNKSDVAGGEVAPVSPQGMETSAEPLIEGGTIPLTSDMPPADEPAPVIHAP